MLRHRRLTSASGRSLIVPVVDPYDPRERAELVRRYNDLTGPVRVRYAPADEIERMMQPCYGAGSSATAGNTASRAGIVSADAPGAGGSRSGERGAGCGGHDRCPIPDGDDGEVSPGGEVAGSV